MFVGVLLFAGVSYVMHNVVNAGEGLVVLPSNALYMVVISAMILLWLSGVLFNSRISAIEQGSPLQERMVTYRSAAILRVALVEAAALIVITGYLLSGTVYYLLLAFVPLYFFVITFPKEEAIVEALELSYSEKQKMV